MGSKIPLYGMVHRIDLFRLVPSDDGAGGILTTPKIFSESARCRVTTLSAEESQKSYGLDSAQHWLVILKRIVDIVEGDDLVCLSVNSMSAPIKRRNSENSLLYYRVLKVKLQQDDLGKDHHMSLVLEKEAVETDT